LLQFCEDHIPKLVLGGNGQPVVSVGDWATKVGGEPGLVVGDLGILCHVRSLSILALDGLLDLFDSVCNSRRHVGGYSDKEMFVRGRVSEVGG